MTTNAMNCELFTDRLLEFLEHELDDATRYAMERHAVACGECGALLADIRKLRMDAANLPQMQPSRDLWSGIAARIEAPVLNIGTVHALPARHGRFRRWMQGALIAASLAGAAGVGYLAAKRGEDPANERIAQVPVERMPGVAVMPELAAIDSATRPEEQPRAGNGQPRAATPAPARLPEVQNVLATLTADYDREIARLRTLIDQRRNQLDPATVAVIERNMQIIDAAIDDSKKAIARDPASRFLIETLNESLRTKVELMRTAALLPSRT
jgi:hypothetical protein